MFFSLFFLIFVKSEKSVRLTGIEMYNNIFKLLGELSENLVSIQKMDYSELKEKVSVIEENYKEIEDNITLNMVDIKPALLIISKIGEELNKLELPIRDIRLLEYAHSNMSFLMNHGYGGTMENDFEDSKPYDSDIKYQVENLGKIINEIKNKYNATERTRDNKA